MKSRHDVDSPTAIRWRDWRAILVRVAQRIAADNVGLLSAGIAFYAFLSVFPAIAAGLMIWGLFTDMTSLGAQLQSISDFAPDAFDLVATQMVVIANQDDGGLTFGLVISGLLALWGANGATSALVQAMNMAYHEKEKRNFFHVTLLTLGFTFCGIIFAALSLASIAFSAYIENFNAYNATFGSLGAVAALLMWFWLSACAICMGAELNSQLELFTTRDTTIDAPSKPGERGAYVADHIENPEQASGPTPQAEDVTKPQELERMTPSRLP